MVRNPLKPDSCRDGYAENPAAVMYVLDLLNCPYDAKEVVEANMEAKAYHEKSHQAETFAVDDKVKAVKPLRPNKLDMP